MYFVVPTIKFHFIFYVFSSKFKKKKIGTIGSYICISVDTLGPLPTTSHHWRHCSNVVPMSQGILREHWLWFTSLGQCNSYSDACCNDSCNSARHQSIPPQVQIALAAPACENSVTQLLQSSVKVSSMECKLTKILYVVLANPHSRYRSSALIECSKWRRSNLAEGSPCMLIILYKVEEEPCLGHGLVDAASSSSFDRKVSFLFTVNFHEEQITLWKSIDERSVWTY